MRFAPIVSLAWRLAADMRRLTRELDETRAELAVAKCRDKRWRSAAEIMAGQDPGLQWLVAKQQWSYDVADYPEIEDRARNTSPRSIP